MLVTASRRADALQLRAYVTDVTAATMLITARLEERVKAATRQRVSAGRNSGDRVLEILLKPGILGIPSRISFSIILSNAGQKSITPSSTTTFKQKSL